MYSPNFIMFSFETILQSPAVTAPFTQGSLKDNFATKMATFCSECYFEAEVAQLAVTEGLFFVDLKIVAKSFSTKILYHEAKMLACKGIFAKPSMAQMRISAYRA